MQWLYGSGFPKSHNLKEAWDGWGTALKPAYEPIILARKPFKKTVASNVLEHGTGALNIDGCRIAGRVQKGAGSLGGYAGSGENAAYKEGTGREYTEGRWPANVILDPEAGESSPEGRGRLGVAGRRVDEDRAAIEGIAHLLDDRLDDVRGRQAEQHASARNRDITRRATDLSAHRREFMATLRVQVVPDDTPPTADQSLGQSTAQQTQADKTNGLFTHRVEDVRTRHHHRLGRMTAEPPEWLTA